MNAKPNNQQAVVYNISNANGSNYVNHAITATTPEAAKAKVKSKQDLHHSLLLMLNTMSQYYLTPFM